MDLRIFTEPQQGATYDDLLAVAQATEWLGFDGFFRSDHYLVMGDSDGLPGPTDAWTTLAEPGVRRVYLQVLDLHDLDHLELVAREVAPQLA